MGSGVGVVVRRLRARQEEIVEALFARVREAVPEATDDPGSEYVRGLRVAVAAAVEFGLRGLERGEGAPAEIPAQAIAQAQLAARSGVSLEAVLRRYIVGHALLWDYVMGEADRVERTGRASGLREMSRAQAALLDQLVIAVTREHVAELQRVGRPREQRVLERVRTLLAVEDADEGPAVWDLGDRDLDLEYDLEGEHLAVIAHGMEAERVLRDLAQASGARLLMVVAGEGAVWAWLGGRSAPRAVELERVLSVPRDRGGKSREGGGESRKGEGGGASEGAVEGAAVGVCVAVGEPARGVQGWRVSHRQAQAAMAVAVRRPRALTRYADVALLATALKDEELSRTLIDVYIAPLLDARGGRVLLQSLRAYLAAERSVSSAAAALGVSRKTVENRVRAIEQRLGRTLHTCPAELEIALLLHELNPTTPAP